jgi:hypothetical protein
MLWNSQCVSILCMHRRIVAWTRPFSDDAAELFMLRF